jgi:nephrocystin-3
MTIQSRLVRVFISSTFRDFIEERDELVKKVFPELRRKCWARQVELVDAALRENVKKDWEKV